MGVTKRDIQARFGGKVEQVGYKQLFIVTQPDRQLLISYKTIVGYKYPANNVWLLTRAKYSPTTSKQLTQFSRGKVVEWIG